MLDFPDHMEVTRYVEPTYSVVQERAHNHDLFWVPQFLSSQSLSILSSSENQIEELARLEENWDGYGGIPINQDTKYNCLGTLRGILGSLQQHPEITPNPNGTLSFEWETYRGEAHLEVGQTKISFYIQPTNGDPVFIDASTSDLLLTSIKIGNLISTYLFPLLHRTTSITEIGLAA